MEWSKRNEYLWESGPFTIELVSPKKWVLTRSEAIDDHVVADEALWTGSSLRRMKAKAESILATEEAKDVSRRHLIVGAIALFVLFASASQSGPIAATLAVAAFAVVLISLVKLIDHAVTTRPWDLIADKYQ